MMKKILFVCTGNTCRSPMAAAVLQACIEKDGRQAEVQAESAGLTAMEGDGTAENAVLAAKAQGMELSRHRARRLTASMVQQAALVLTMTAKHKAAILSAMPEASGKVFVFTEYADFSGDITDPFGGDFARYTQCLQDMQRCMAGIWQKFCRYGNAD